MVIKKNVILLVRVKKKKKKSNSITSIQMYLICYFLKGQQDV
jgi:hypothetical protein